MRGQDDRHPVVAQPPDHRPHVAAQFDIDARRRLVEEQQIGFVGQRLGDQHAALHPARQLHDLGVALVPQRQRCQHALDRFGRAGLAEQPARKGDNVADRLEHVGRQLLRHKANPPPRRAPPLVHVDAVEADRAARGVHQPANRANERRLPRAIGPEQRKNLAAHDVERHVIERAVATGVGFAEIGDGEDGGHRDDYINL
jgi:hypothetical protein